MILGVVWLVAGGVSLFLNWRLYSSGVSGSLSFWGALVVGAGLGALAMRFVWPYDAMTKIAGFPFAAALFQRSVEGGPYLDFVGPLTFPFLILDALCWGLFIQILMYIFYRKRAAR